MSAVPPAPVRPRRPDAQMRDTRNERTAAGRTSGSTLAEIADVGPIIAAAIIGHPACCPAIAS